MDLPEAVYKYRVWDKENNRTIISRREVHFASPSSFKDKLDCKIPVRWDLLTLKQIFHIYFHDSKIANKGFSRQQHKRFARESAERSPFKDKEYLKQRLKIDKEEFDECFGVLSLTSNSKSTNLWVDYADNHQGFAVGFDPKIVFKYFGEGGPVSYCDKLPIIYPYPIHTYEEQHFLQVFSKLKCWELEDEYRTHIFKTSGLASDDRLVKIPPEGYREIILGAFMNEKNRKDLISSIPEELKNVPVKKASIVDNKIVIEELN